VQRMTKIARDDANRLGDDANRLGDDANRGAVRPA